MKMSKKLVCLFLSVLMLVLSFSGSLSALAAEHCETVPTVYITGASTIYVTRADGTKYAPLNEDSYDIAEISKKVLPLLLDALKTGDFTEYGNALYACIAPSFAQIKVNGDGTVAENTGVYNPWTPDQVNTRHDASLTYANYYGPDLRISPVAVVDEINTLVETVKAKTGHSKVNIVGRCLGGNFVMAYLAKCGWDSINRVVFLTSCHNGTERAEGIVSGKASFDSDALTRFLKTKDLKNYALGPEIMEYILMTLDMLRETYTDEMVMKIGELLYGKIKDTVIAPLLRDYYAPGQGLACANENFEEALEYLFPTQELKQEYAGVIENAKDYHYNVQMKADEILKEMDEAGIPIFSFVEYGFQQAPVYGKESAKVGDNAVGVKKASNGAVTSEVNSTLSQKYIDSRIEAGYGKYISPDKQIDASTCLFPDRTWFAKGINHEYPASVGKLTSYFLYTQPAPTIDSDERYPQYMLYHANDSFSKLDESNCNTMDWDSMENTTDQTRNFIETIVNFFKKFLNDFLDKIFEFVDKIKGVPHTKRNII